MRAYQEVVLVVGHVLHEGCVAVAELLVECVDGLHPRPIVLYQGVVPGTHVDADTDKPPVPKAPVLESALRCLRLLPHVPSMAAFAVVKKSACDEPGKMFSPNLKS